MPMGRRKKGQRVHGWVVLDKPLDVTSTQAVGKVRRFFDAQKAGHAGTLDPLASGILPIALGEATKTIPYIQDALKIYRFSVTWGQQRSTDDAEGEVVAQSDVRPAQDDILAVLPAFIGDISQVPPAFSALKIDGQRAYDLARDGQDVQLKARPVYIERLELLAARDGEADFEMLCGKGTYVRSLARDLALKLGTYGYVSALRRCAVGVFDEDHAISLAILEEMADKGDLSAALLPIDSGLDDILALSVSDNEAAKLRNGQVLIFASRADFQRLEGLGSEAIAKCGDKPVAIVSLDGAKVKPGRVFVD